MVAGACRFELAPLLAKPAQDALGLGNVFLLAGKIARSLRQSCLELGLARFGARFLAFQRIALDAQAMQHGGARSLLVTQRLKLLGGFRLLAQRLALGLGFLRHGGKGLLERRLLLLDMGAGADPMKMVLQRLHLANLAGDFAIALGLPGLAAHRLQLRRELADQIGQTREIGLGGIESELGLVPAAVQTGNAGGIFQHAAAFLRRGVDDLADPPLTHQRRRPRAGGRVLEQQPDVARPRILAVDPIGRACLALDPARHFERVRVVELGRRGPRAVVDEQRDLGAVTRRPRLGAGEDHVLHRRAAHRLVRGLAHGPAQRLEQVRLAAAIGPDHAGQPGLDQQLGGLDKRLKAEKAKTGDLHAENASLVEDLTRSI